MSKISISDIPKCIVPNCEGRRAAKGHRGKNSPIVDQSKRWPFCRKHLKGTLKAERIAWQVRDKEQS